MPHDIVTTKLERVLMLAHSEEPSVHPEEIKAVLLNHYRGQGHQQWLDMASAEELAEWAIARAIPFTGPDDDDDFDCLVAALL